MGAQRHREAAVIVHDLLAQGEVGQGDGRFEIAHPRTSSNGRGDIGEAAHRPQHVAAREAQRGEGIGAGQGDDLALGEAGAPPQVGGIAIGRRRAALDHAVDVVLGEARRPGASRGAGRSGCSDWVGSSVQSQIAGIHVGRPHLDAVFAGIAHELGRRIEAHRLGVEQGGGEDLGIVMFHPRRVVDQDREARGMAFGKAVFAEAFDLLEAALGEVALVAVVHHALDEVVLELVDRAGPAERRHGATQLVGLLPAEPGARRWRSASPVPGTAARPASSSGRLRVRALDR